MKKLFHVVVEMESEVLVEADDVQEALKVANANADQHYQDTSAQCDWHARGAREITKKRDVPGDWVGCGVYGGDHVPEDWFPAHVDAAGTPRTRMSSRDIAYQNLNDKLNDAFKEIASNPTPEMEAMATAIAGGPVDERFVKKTTYDIAALERAITAKKPKDDT